MKANRFDKEQAYADGLAAKIEEDMNIEYSYVYQDIANQERIANKEQYSKQLIQGYHCLRVR